MLKLSNIFESLLRESHPEFNSSYFKTRIPFLKDYEVQYAPDDYPKPSQPQRVEMLYTKAIPNVALKFGDDIVNIPKLYVVSKFIYYPHKIDENTFHHFIIENEATILQPENMDNLSYRVFMAASKQMNDKMSYSGEIRLSNGENMKEEELNKIMNEINKRLFQFEDFVSTAYGSQAY